MPTAPLDWTSYDRRPGAGTPAGNAYGLGCITGYSPVSVYDPAKPQYPVASLDRGPLILEFESSPAAPLDVRKASPASVASVAAGMLTEAWSCAGAKKAGQAFGWYCPPIERTYFIGDNKVSADGLYHHRRSVRFLAACEVAAPFSFIVVDLHRMGEQTLADWKAMAAWTIDMMAQEFALPVVPVIDERFHPASRTVALREKNIPPDEIAAMFAFAAKSRVQRVARMGGYDTIGVPGGFARRPYGSNPAEAAINRALGVLP